MKLTRERLYNFIKPKPWEKDVVIFILFITLLAIAVTSIYGDYKTTNAIKEFNDEKLDYQSLLKTAEDYKKQGDQLFDSAHIQYELKNYDNANKLCKEARTNLSEAVNYFARTTAALENLKWYELIELSNLKINISIASYEACELFEDAMINYEQGDIARGNAKLQDSNEKIRLHDELVMDYTFALSKSKQKLYKSPSS